MVRMLLLKLSGFILLLCVLQCTASCLVEIMCDVNGYQIPAVVDTGSEITVMSESCAKRCKIFNAIDISFAGKVNGVGTGEIIGAVENQSLHIGKLRFGTKLSVLRKCRRDLIVGLDVLERFQSEVNLSERSVTFKVRGTTVKVPVVGAAPAIATQPPTTLSAPQLPTPVAAPTVIQELSGGFYESDFADEFDEIYDDVVSMEGV